MTTVQKGARGQEVITIQCALASTGLYSGDIDGCFGNQLEAALVAFQTRKGLPANGVVDAPTAAALGIPDSPPVVCRYPGVTPQTIAPMFPGTPLVNIEANLPYVLNALADADLCDREMILMALATIRAEAASFLPISEFQSPYNTSPGGHPFDKYDTMSMLGNKGAPDGANFRGRGFIQLTGRSNYQTYGAAIGQELTESPLSAHHPEIAAKLLVSFLKAHEQAIRAAIAANNLAKARELVNGGTNGLPEFEDAFNTGLKLIPSTPSTSIASA